MARSSCYGSRHNKPLDRDILSACISKLSSIIIIIHNLLFIEYVQMKHSTVARTVLVDAVNDKCANCR